MNNTMVREIRGAKINPKSSFKNLGAQNTRGRKLREQIRYFTLHLRCSAMLRRVYSHSPTFRENLSVPSSSAEQSFNCFTWRYRQVVPKRQYLIADLRRIISQNSEHHINTAAEAWYSEHFWLILAPTWQPFCAAKVRLVTYTREQSSKPMALQSALSCRGNRTFAHIQRRAQDRCVRTIRGHRGTDYARF